jgi:hypothetical protein
MKNWQTNFLEEIQEKLSAHLLKNLILYSRGNRPWHERFFLTPKKAHGQFNMHSRGKKALAEAKIRILIEQKSFFQAFSVYGMTHLKICLMRLLFMHALLKVIIIKD